MKKLTGAIFLNKESGKIEKVSGVMPSFFDDFKNGVIKIDNKLNIFCDTIKSGCYFMFSDNLEKLSGLLYNKEKTKGIFIVTTTKTKDYEIFFFGNDYEIEKSEIVLN